MDVLVVTDKKVTKFIEHMDSILEGIGTDDLTPDEQILLYTVTKFFHRRQDFRHYLKSAVLSFMTQSIAGDLIQFVKDMQRCGVNVEELDADELLDKLFDYDGLGGGNDD